MPDGREIEEALTALPEALEDLTSGPAEELRQGVYRRGLLWNPVSMDLSLDDHVVRLLHTVGHLSRNGQVVNVLAVGPKRTRETSLPKEFAAAERWAFFTLYCPLISKRDKRWGSKELSLECDTYFVHAAFLNGVELKGWAILHV